MEDVSFFNEICSTSRSFGRSFSWLLSRLKTATSSAQFGFDCSDPTNGLAFGESFFEALLCSWEPKSNLTAPTDTSAILPYRIVWIVLETLLLFVNLFDGISENSDVD